MPAQTKHPSFDVMRYLSNRDKTRKLSNYRAGQILFRQGDSADTIFYIRSGKVKVTVTSARGKEAIVAIRGPDEFCGEGALTGHALRLASVTAMTPCEIVPINLKSFAEYLHQDVEFADFFLAHLLHRTARVEADLVDHLFNSSEMRLARALLLMANYGNRSEQAPTPVHVNQETLAELIGTTRSRVNIFMNKFRKMGLINYNGKLEVHQALLNFVLLDKAQMEM
jgi:CRP/FNR family transcriptional regulator, cyclic AMP receptor protein